MNSLAQSVARERLSQCIHCGLCLPACPTYEVFRTEMDGPRGRIALMRAVAEGRIGIEGAFEEHIDRCLGCRACETACPSGVEYGALLDSAQETLAVQRTPSMPARLGRWLALRQALPHRRRLRRLSLLLRSLEVLGVMRLESVAWLPAPWRRMIALWPRGQSNTAVGEDRGPAPAFGEKRGTVAFFRGCVQDALFPQVNAATVRVLQRNGFEVHFPPGQTCCGAAAHHLGEGDLARDLARRNIAAFASGTYDAILNNAGGCGAQLKSIEGLVADEPEMAAAAHAFAAKVRDVCEFLAENLHTPPMERVGVRATYADSCHLRHAQGVVSAPRALLGRIPGLELVELERADACCGSAGVYNILHPDTADQVLDAKLADVDGTGANVVVTTNTGCQLQYLYGMRKAGLEMRVAHVVELLDQAYGGRATHESTD